MYGTASSTKLQLVASLGATPIDYRSEDFVEYIQHLPGGGIDAVFDAVGGRH
jgi:NADPH:quinone reductase-like Zn-dependent oxidoreductase